MAQITMSAPTYTQLVKALGNVLDAFDYCGGGDTWEREVWAEDIAEAKALRDLAASKNVPALPPDDYQI
jgi:hypothetical protein